MIKSLAAVLLSCVAVAAFAETGTSQSAQTTQTTQTAQTTRTAETIRTASAATSSAPPAVTEHVKRQKAYQPMPDSMRPEADPDKKDRH